MWRARELTQGHQLTPSGSLPHVDGKCVFISFPLSILSPLSPRTWCWIFFLENTGLFEQAFLFPNHSPSPHHKIYWLLFIYWDAGIFLLREGAMCWVRKAWRGLSVYVSHCVGPQNALFPLVSSWVVRKCTGHRRPCSKDSKGSCFLEANNRMWPGSAKFSCPSAQKPMFLSGSSTKAEKVHGTVCGTFHKKDHSQVVQLMAEYRGFQIHSLGPQDKNFLGGRWCKTSYLDSLNIHCQICRSMDWLRWTFGMELRPLQVTWSKSLLWSRTFFLEMDLQINTNS